MKKKLPKQPKALKLPKKPKNSASLETWRKWKYRHEQTISKNAQKQASWKRACEKIHSEEKERLALIKKFSR